MPTGQGNRNPWSDTEKLSVLFQIIEKVGTVPWDEIKLPADRTLLAAKKMLNNEKEKMTALISGEGSGSPTKKRAAGAKADGESPEKKAKPRAPRKNAKKGKAASEEAAAGEDEEDAEAEGVKAEPEEEGDGFET
ncbi:hypothetical protein LTR97_003300 [Elasticomyces elasticus]|uniref:Uncharacterized protein n=1 Tax=Elasticomyces elasticus TaxID=574655 RepID=A0AAN7WAQ4_9PEZI|nr:hypothetical protein LTR97_003300 [Elasticomyces elasticus]